MQEFKVYKNVLRRLINQAKNLIYSSQFENKKGDRRKTCQTVDNLLHRKALKINTRHNNS